MGRNARIKRYRKALVKKLEEKGLQDKQFLVVSKTRMVPELVLEGGKPKLDDKGRAQFKMKKIESMRARNPLRSLLRKILKEDEGTIRAYLGLPGSKPSSNRG